MQRLLLIPVSYTHLDYTRKSGVICSDILLPSHAPPEYADRPTLWNAVEKAERGTVSYTHLLSALRLCVWHF